MQASKEISGFCNCHKLIQYTGNYPQLNTRNYGPISITQLNILAALRSTANLWGALATDVRKLQGMALWFCSEYVDNGTLKEKKPEWRRSTNQ